ncbi:hypothetical protein [Robiginitalea sp. IMCC43444]|uniref:hypothetical protein n=1 Tax=Robiginitalea sp. IMCC43444 TaxID=3459121 RepID=UPI0040413D6E
MKKENDHSDSKTKATSKLRYHYRQWILKATAGVSLIGFGACLVAEAAMLKFQQEPTLNWTGYGLVALVVLNTGVCLFGDAVKHRTHFERLNQRKSEG